MKTLIKLMLIFYFLFIGFAGKSQTIVKDLPIISGDAFTILVWLHDDATKTWKWFDVNETHFERDYGWIYERRIQANVEMYGQLDILILRGFDDCSDTTKVTIYGSYEKEIIKDKPNFRKTINVDGGKHTFGTYIEKPKL